MKSDILPNNFIIYIVGNIGAGKTTFIKKHFESWNVINEPLLPDLLNNYYNNTSSIDMGYLQHYFQTSRLLALMDIKTQFNVSDRSLQSGELFTQLMKDAGNFKDDVIYQAVLSVEHRGRLYNLSNYKEIVIYLQVPVEICLERILKRDGPHDKNISVDYLKKVEAAHESIYGNQKKNLYVLNTNQIDSFDMATFIKELDI